MNASDPWFASVQALTAYWLAHPDAADSLEGICRWWLEDAEKGQAEVEQALAWLVARGVVQVKRAADGRLHYRLADSGRAGHG